MLYTTQEIADRYGGEQKNVTPYMITHTWIPNGLKFVKGKGSGYLYKIEWVEEYLENQAQIPKEKSNRIININKKNRKNCKRNSICSLKRKERGVNEKQNLCINWTSYCVFISMGNQCVFII